MDLVCLGDRCLKHNKYTQVAATATAHLDTLVAKILSLTDL